jgi:hypothetical protein
MQRKSVKPKLTKKNEPFTEVMDFNNPSFKFAPEGKHTYRQQGGYLVCMSCELKHAVWIGMNKRMIGEDEKGNPILEKITDL